MGPGVGSDHMSNMLLGIGNPLRKDDGVGNYVASRIQAEGWEAHDCGATPENFSGMVRRLHPDLLILVDAAFMGLAAGEIAIIPKGRIRDVGLGTHQLPLDIFIDFLEDAAGEIILIGIEPMVVEVGEGLSPEVRKGADRLVATLERGGARSIPILESDPEERSGCPNGL